MVGVNTSTLVELRSDEPPEFQQVGDKLYMDSENSIYIIPDAGGTPILITEEGDISAYLYEDYGYSDPDQAHGNDFRKAHAVVAKDDGPPQTDSLRASSV